MIVQDWSGYLEFRKAFSEILDARFHSIEWLDMRIIDGSAHFWRSENAAIIAEIRTYPTGAREVHGLIASGDLHEIVELIPLAEQWGRDRGCITACIESREGWAKMLPEYSIHQVAIRKEL